MQKKLIALAIAGLSSAAFAQSNVTIYGVMDLGQAWVKSSDDSTGAAGQRNVGRLDSNSSYIGFKGAESLGNGLTAVFQYESGFTADTAGALAGGRDTYIGLAGGFGTVAAGNLTHPLRAMGAKVELTPGAAGFGTMASVTGYIQGVGQTGADNRAANAIAYISPSFSGFTVVAAYVNGEAKPVGTAADGDAKAAQIALQYDNGPLYAGLAYHKADDLGGVSTTDARVWRLAAAYNFSTGTKVTGLYDNTKVETAGGDLKRNAWSLGVAQPFGASTIGLEYARANDVSGTSDTGNKITTLVYTYQLSKRTMVHARYSKLDNDSAAQAAFYNNPVANPTALGVGSDSTGYMVGLRHTF